MRNGPPQMAVGRIDRQVVVWLVWSKGQRSVPPGDQTVRALHILDERHALGDMGRDEYFERKADLEA